MSKIEALSSKSITRGSLALGIVLSVSQQSALVSLPGGHIGKLNKGDVSDVDVSNVKVSVRTTYIINEII